MQCSDRTSVIKATGTSGRLLAAVAGWCRSVVEVRAALRSGLFVAAIAAAVPGAGAQTIISGDQKSATTTPAELSGTTKVDVDLAALRTFLASPAAAGASLVGDFGSFSVYRIDASMAEMANAIDGVTVRADYDRIMLRRVELDSRSGSRTPNVAGASRTLPQRHLGLVQFAGPVTDAQLELLTRNGTRLVHYIPQNAYIVWTQTQQQRNELVASVGEGQLLQFFDDFTPDDALSPMLDARMGTVGDVEVTVQVYNAPADEAKAIDASEQVLAFASSIIAEPHSVLDGLYTNMTIRVPAPALAVIAAMDHVVNVEPHIEPTMNSERQAQVMAGNLNAGGTGPSGAGYLAWLNGRGFPATPASYPVLSVVDGGVDNGSTTPLDRTLRLTGAAAGATRITSNLNATSDASGSGLSGHGHINASIAMGYDVGVGLLDGAYLRGMGINPHGRIAAVKIFTNAGAYSIGGAGGTDAGLIQYTWNQGADMSTNSWGAAVGGTYTAAAQAYDRGTRDASTTAAGNQQLFFIFSAGNSGAGATTIGSPGTAKNVLTVGASEDTDNSGTDGCGTTAAEADNIQQIVGFSSRGPCTDGRAKPEIVAPGTHIAGTANPAAGYTGGGVCDQYWPASQTVYARSSGTSHSTPAVAGMASLTWNYLSRVHGIARPSPALTKAYIIHTARYLGATGGNLPQAAQGYGFTDMDSAFNGSANRALVDQTQVLGATGESRTIGGSIADSTKPIRVALVWTDAAGSTGGNAWVNDLNLTVTVNGITYRGNVFTGANSVTGGVADTRNNYECVFLPAGTTGPISVTVTAGNVAGDGVPGNADATDQDYALVVSNMTQTGIVLNGTGANTISDATGNGNNNTRIDPGESAIRVTVPVVNNGPSAATGVNGTLVSNTPTVSVTTAASTYANLAGAGGTASNATPFVLNVSPSHPCGSPILLTLNLTSAQGPGTYSFSLPTGLTGTTFAYTGPAVAIPDASATGASVTLPVSGVSTAITNLRFRFDGSSCNATVGSTTVGLDHTYVGDLTITLQSPAGTIVTLVSRAGAGGNNFCSTVFDDAASTGIQSITAAGNPYSGSYTPNSPLAAFNGQSANGNWILKAVDGAGVDTGSIRAFSLLFTTTTSPTCDPPASGCTGPAFSSNPASTIACIGGSASFTAAASGTPTPTYTWYKNSTLIPGATGPTYTIPSVTAGDATTYFCRATSSCGSVDSTAATLTVNTPVSIGSSPSNRTLCQGASTTFAVSATGSPAPTYQWRFNTNPIGGATSSSYTIPSVSTGNTGSYDCVVTNSCGSVTSTAATLTVNTPASITGQPVSTSSCIGGSASFTVVASGTPTPTFQWRRNTTPIGGANAATYTIPSVSAGDAASYDCIVTNSCGSVTSNAATLSIGGGIEITQQPQSIDVCPGQPATFSVTATGASGYQWNFNTSPISGATAATYSINAASATDAGSYTCTVSGSCGTITSNAAALSIGSVAPANDTVSGAIALSLGVAESGNTCAATIDSDQVVCSSQTISAGGVWYRITGDGNTATVALCGSSYDTRLSAYCGSPTGLTCVTGNDDTCGLSSSVTFCTQAGADYYLLVHGFTTSTGAFSILYTSDLVACTPTITCVAVGACCLPTGCEQLTLSACELAGGTYAGDGIACTGASYTDAFASADTFPIAIPDFVNPNPGVATSTVVVGPGAGTVDTLAIRVGLDHTFVGDLTATLSNGSTSILLMNRTGVGNDLDGDYIFSDLAATTFVAGAAAGSPIAAGAYQPLTPLSAFDGQPLSGTWTLTVSDFVGQDVGNIRSFTLLSTSQQSSCSSCPPCAADFNQDGGVDGDDVGVFFTDWENGLPCADVNLDGGVDGSDIDIFFAAWEAGGC
jgi:subtilisin-like proprotein convertase family protein